MDVKSLKVLAKACREVGINHFKNSEVEFSLTDESPRLSYYKRKKNESTITVEEQQEIDTDNLTRDQLLMWSTGEGLPGNETEGNT